MHSEIFMCLAQIISYSDLYCQFIIINPTFQQVCEQFQILARLLTSERQLLGGLALCMCKLSGCRAEDRCAVNIGLYSAFLPEIRHRFLALLCGVLLYFMTNFA